MVTQSGAITGGGLQTLAAGLGLPGVKARAIQFVAASANSGTPLVGGYNMNPGDASPLTAGNGFPVMKTAYLYLPYISLFSDMYQMDNMYVYVAPGDTLYVLFELG